MHIQGAITKKTKRAQSEGLLKVKPRPFKVGTTSTKWLDEMVHDSLGIDGSLYVTPLHLQPLQTLTCPLCRTEVNTAGLKLRNSKQFSNLTCRKCHGITKSDKWNCTCNMNWIRCSMHASGNVISECEVLSGRPPKRKRLVAVSGVDKPFPKRRKSNTTSQDSNCHFFPIRLSPDSKWASKFPGLVVGSGAPV